MSENSKPYRSFLFVPGSRPERFEKALHSGADAVILDLEDAVAPEDKEGARQTIAAWLAPERAILVRINPASTPWYEQDAQLGKLRGVAGIVLPKAESARDVTDLISRIKRQVPVYPLIESAKGMWNALEIARAPCVHQLMFGTLDFGADMNMETDGDSLDTFRAQLTMISRVADIHAPIDGVTPSIDDAELLQAETIKAKRFGFAGKLCIHPRQVSIVNRTFAPGESELAWARRVLHAFGSANGAAVAVDGKMVDRPVILKAQSILDADRSTRSGTDAV
ncbi:CoA ester lyase [Paraburkholderia sp. Tr-20389]|uniref:HpcH/HpaI aldolase/citrate lyase family protein n=1 Tax=Paraburkholderia sp. Tr-20389 TaxID=2703903 RepID=UPI00197F0332|nr:CoA ester lyase [Paraburkholderia sp. Tr-20389]MBN3754474.1 CoA ester lyase [Paraburkholderia sp. Tr-20389]